MLDADFVNRWRRSSLAYVKRAIEIAANGKHNIMIRHAAEAAQYRGKAHDYRGLV